MGLPQLAWNHRTTNKRSLKSAYKKLSFALGKGHFILLPKRARQLDLHLDLYLLVWGKLRSGVVMI